MFERAALRLAMSVAWLALGSASAWAANVENTCGGFFTCIIPCPADDQPCLQACLPTDAVEQQRLTTLINCIQAACGQVADADLEACIAQGCPSEVSLCINGPTGTGNPCGPDVPFQGRCEGNTLIWCFNAEENKLDCSKKGHTCGFNPESQTFDCLGQDIDVNPGVLVGAGQADDGGDQLFGLAGLASCSAGAGPGAGFDISLILILVVWLATTRRRA